MKIKNIMMLIVCFFLLAGFTDLISAEKEILLKNANIITISGDTIRGGDLLIRGSKIAKAGKNLTAAKDAEIIDLSGKWIMPGIIDSHSHIALEGSVNEMGNLMTPEVDVRDIIHPDDINIFYALTGGVTAVHTMHGSANPIGGQGIVLKLKWGVSADEMIYKKAPRTIKWALGENPKQSNSYSPGPSRYPRTRMGVEASIRKIFEEAKQYKKRWDEYNARVKSIKNKEDLPLPPRKDLRLEVVNDILSGKLWIRCHAYQAPEMLSIMKLCKEYGVKLVCYEHGLEGYRIADELKQYGVAVSTFADFWGYKWEAFFTMPHSIALMAKRGVLVAINSDDAERMRRLFLDAAKTIRFGGVSELEALKMITINPAKILGIDKWTGTIEEGKDADIAVFSRHPLDPYTICEMTIVEGKIYFDRAKYVEDRKKAEEERKKAEEKRRKAEEAKKKAEEEKKKAEEARKEEPQKVKPDNIEI